MALIQTNEEYNMESVVRTVTPNGAKKSIVRAFKKKRPIFMWGPPGIGKSDIVGQITQQLKKSHLIDVRLSLWEPTDIKGIPYYSANDNTMAWAPPAELPTQEFAAQFDNIVFPLAKHDAIIKFSVAPTEIFGKWILAPTKPLGALA